LEIWETSLVREIQSGEEEAFERCYRLLSPQVYSSIFKICGNHDTANELMQDTFIDVYESIRSFTPNKSFVGWVKRIAYNNTISFLRKNQRLVLNEALIAEQESDEYIHCELEDTQLLDKVLSQVSESERLVLWLFIVEQYNHREIGEMLGYSASYSKSLLSRVLKRMKSSSEVKSYAL